MYYDWLVIIPPLIVVVLATATRRVLFSLMMGIVSASLIANDFVPWSAAKFAAVRFFTMTELYKLTSWESLTTGSNIFIMLFLLIIGILITMIQASGAAYAYGDYVSKRLKTGRDVEISSLILSTMFFIDDYFSCLTVGSVMQPVTDCFRIPRAKLAVLVSMIAAPLALIVPMTSWVAEITGQFRNAGVSLLDQASTIIRADPIHLYIITIPCMLYALMVIASLWYVVTMQLSFGVIARQEGQAKLDGNLFGGKMPISGNVQRVLHRNGTLFDFLLPIITLFVSIFLWIITVGSWRGIGGAHSMLEAIQHANIFAGLFVGGLVTVILTFCYLLYHKKLVVSSVRRILSDGVNVMGGSIVMLILIWSLSSMLSQDLATGSYVAKLLLGYVNISLLPVLFFVMAALISILIGTAWGTLGMLVPLAVHMVPAFLSLSVPFTLNDATMLLPVLGAIISGSIVGNHVSPIADVMLMAAMSTGSYHLDVVKSMISISLPTFLSSCCAYIIIGQLIQTQSYFLAVSVSFFTGLLINFILLHSMQVISHYKKQK